MEAGEITSGEIPAAPCDHDGRASGRLVLEHTWLRREVVCECGEMLLFLGRSEYRVAGWSPGDHRPSRERWRRSRALLFSVASHGRWRSDRGSHPRRGRDKRRAGRQPAGS
jgi:hypothetical protein